jgi:hypothetical protein
MVFLILKQSDDFIALCGVITVEFLERETLEIDMIPMLGRNTLQKK